MVITERSDGTTLDRPAVVFNPLEAIKSYPHLIAAANRPGIRQTLERYSVLPEDSRWKYESHSVEVADLTYRIATRLMHQSRLTEQQVMEVTAAALVHDVGDTHPDILPHLNTPRRDLNNAQWRLLTIGHVQEGVRMLQEVGAYTEADIVAHHHTFQEEGYPNLEQSDATSARRLQRAILAMTDQLQVMMARRIYDGAEKTAKTKDQVREDLLLHFSDFSDVIKIALEEAYESNLGLLA